MEHEETGRGCCRVHVSGAREGGRKQWIPAGISTVSRPAGTGSVSGGGQQEEMCREGPEAGLGSHSLLVANGGAMTEF